MSRGKPLNMKLNLELKDLAEREGFEPPLPFRVNLISRTTTIRYARIPTQRFTEESSYPLPSRLRIFASLCE